MIGHSIDFDVDVALDPRLPDPGPGQNRRLLFGVLASLVPLSFTMGLLVDHRSERSPMEWAAMAGITLSLYWLAYRLVRPATAHARLGSMVLLGTLAIGVIYMGYLGFTDHPWNMLVLVAVLVTGGSLGAMNLHATHGG